MTAFPLLRILFFPAVNTACPSSGLFPVYLELRHLQNSKRYMVLSRSNISTTCLLLRSKQIFPLYLTSPSSFTTSPWPCLSSQIRGFSPLIYFPVKQSALFVTLHLRDKILDRNNTRKERFVQPRGNPGLGCHGRVAPGTWEEHHGSRRMQRVKKQAVHLRSERKQRERNGPNKIKLRTCP